MLENQLKPRNPLNHHSYEDNLTDNSSIFYTRRAIFDTNQLVQFFIKWYFIISASITIFSASYIFFYTIIYTHTHTHKLLEKTRLKI